MYCKLKYIFVFLKFIFDIYIHIYIFNYFDLDHDMTEVWKREYFRFHIMLLAAKGEMFRANQLFV